MKYYGFIYKPPTNELIAEWGSSMPIKWPDPENVKMYDSEGKEVPIPKCDKCQAFKQEVIGLNAYTWICTNGCENKSN